MQPLIRLDDVTKDYGRLRALDRVSLSIGPGVTGLLGPNGAGKTTLIQVLLGLVKVTAGKGEVLNHRLPYEARAIRARVGYMPEDDCYIGGLSGVEMVQYMARLWGQPGVEGLRRSHEMLDYCGIRQERYRDVATYSTGMRQKLKFAQALVHDPPLLILDEPTAGLDPTEREALLDRIRMLSTRWGKAVLLSTHILPDVQSVCDHVVIMARGRVRLAGQLETLIRPASPGWEVVILGAEEPFLAEAHRAGCTTALNGSGSVTVHGLSEDQGSVIWQWARAAGVGLRTVKPTRSSLEQVFFEAIRESSGASS